jgi:hypothetical protein
MKVYKRFPATALSITYQRVLPEIIQPQLLNELFNYGPLLPIKKAAASSEMAVLWKLYLSEWGCGNPLSLFGWLVFCSLERVSGFMYEEYGVKAVIKLHL